jgi:MYXO-CTERM domain-containing protein
MGRQNQRERNHLRLAAVGAVTLAAWATATPAEATVVFRDPFNDGSPTTNTGAGAVGDASPWATGGAGATATEAANGPLTFGVGAANYNKSWLTGRTVGPTFNIFAPSTSTTLRFTTSNVVITTENNFARTDVPGSGVGDFRYEVGFVSTTDPVNAGNPDEAFTASSGGIYLTLFVNGDGNDGDTTPARTVTGSLRVTNGQKSTTAADSEAAVGLKTIATFTFDTYNGTDALQTALTVDQNGYSLAFDKAVTFNTGTASGGWGLEDDATPADSWFTTDQFASGAFLNALGMNWVDGRASGQLNNIEVDVVPEPAGLGLLGLAAIGLLRRRRTA